MKYRIVYLNEYSTSAVYLVGYDKNNKPIYRRHTTKAPVKLSEAQKADARALLSCFMNF